MKYYNKQTARGLYAELKERLDRIPKTIDEAPDDGPVIHIIAAALGAAISALKHGPQNEA